MSPISAALHAIVRGLTRVESCLPEGGLRRAEAQHGDGLDGDGPPACKASRDGVLHTDRYKYEGWRRTTFLLLGLHAAGQCLPWRLCACKCR